MRTLAALALLALSALVATADPLDCIPFAGTMQPLSRADYYYGRHVVFAGNHLLAAGTQSGLVLFDISDPSQPVQLNQVPIPPGVLHLAVRGHLIYYTTRLEFGIYDITDPLNPLQVHTVAGDAAEIAVAGELLAVQRLNGVSLYSLANPESPVLLASLAENAQPVFLDATRLALLASGFAIYDITDPTAPQETNRLVYDTYGYPGYTVYVANLTLWNDTVVGRVVDHFYSGSMQWGDYHSTSYYTRRQFDISSPGEPVEMQQVETGVYETRSTLMNGPRFPLLRIGDLFIDRRDVFAPATGSLATVSRIPQSSPTSGGLAAGIAGELFVVSSDEVLTVAVAALSVPNAVTVDHSSSEYLTAAASADLFVNVETTEYGEIGWLHEYFYGFAPDAVNELLFSELDGGGKVRVFGRDVFVFGSGWHHRRVVEDGVVEGALYIWGVDEVLDGPGETVVVLRDALLSLHDLTDAAAPVDLGTLDLVPAGIGTVNHASIAGDLVLVSGDQGVAVVSVADPLDPALLATVMLDDAQWAVTTGAAEATILAGGQLHRLDLSDPAAPTIAFAVPAGMVESPLTVVGGHGYALQGDVLVLVDLATLEVVGATVFNEAQHALHVAADGSLLVAGNHNGWTAVPAACEASVVAVPGEIPAGTQKLTVYPNPFNPQTTVRLDLATPGPVRLEIFDTRGRRVREFRLGDLPAGEFRVTWEGRDDAGREAPAGIYLLRLTSPSGTTTARAALIR